MRKAKWLDTNEEFYLCPKCGYPIVKWEVQT